MKARIVVGQGSCGLAAGAGAVYTALENKLTSDAASLSITGCIGICYLEPIVDVYDEEGKLYRCVQVKPEDADKIVSAATTGDYSLLNDIVIKEEDAQFLSKQTRIALRHCGLINPDEIGPQEHLYSTSANRHRLKIGKYLFTKIIHDKIIVKSLYILSALVEDDSVSFQLGQYTVLKNIDTVFQLIVHLIGYLYN